MGDTTDPVGLVDRLRAADPLLSDLRAAAELVEVLTAERDRLRDENERLRRLLAPPNPDPKEGKSGVTVS
jgi:hypothetical protein